MLLFAVASAIAAENIAIREVGDAVRVEADGKLFTEYRYKNVARPYCYPVIGVGGASMTRDWPMKESATDARDHVHHKGLWFAHNNINGVNFWAEQEKYGKTVHEKFLDAPADSIRSRNKWVAPDGKTICADERTIRFAAMPDARLIDYEVTLIASQGEVTLGDTKECMMAIRVPTAMAVKNKASPGHIITSAGDVDGAAWSKRAMWVDYHGVVAGKHVGVAMFDHPQNLRHPTWWHVREYGLFAANPFGIHEFEKKPAGAGNMTLAAGKSITFRYRFVFHAGDEKEGKVAERYREFAETK